KYPVFPGTHAGHPGTRQPGIWRRTDHHDATRRRVHRWHRWPSRWHCNRILTTKRLAEMIDPFLVLALLALGAITGFAAGLLGIGGGMILVPVLTFIFIRVGFSSDHVVHMAIATSLSDIFFTSISSVYAHHRRGAIRW